MQNIAPYEKGELKPFFAPTCLLVWLALVGKVFELRARERSASALMKLTPLAPKTARGSRNRR